MFLRLIIFIHLTFSQDFNSQIIYSDCKHLILPNLCQCYHSGDQSQLRCHNIQLQDLPKLPNNLRWNALDFSSNNLKSIGSYVFSGIHVERLNFKYNYIQTIDLTAFTDIEKLKELYLNNNRLKELEPDILISPGITLEILDLSNNPLGYLNLTEIFNRVPYLREFHAVSCQLNDPSLLIPTNATIHNHYTLELLDLSSNNLTSLCNEFFNQFYNLIELRLTNNQIYAIDNYFLSALKSLKILDLALNSMEQMPKLVSSSLEHLNLSSNNLHNLTDFFAANLPSIRTINFDSNRYFDTISSQAFCSMNLSTLDKLSFRSTNLPSLTIFVDLLCRLDEHKYLQETILDLNENINLKCDCFLVQYEKYLIDYRHITCTQEGQDRFFISTITNTVSNCSWDICYEIKRNDVCLQASNSYISMSKDFCQEKIIEERNRTKFLMLTTTTTTIATRTTGKSNRNWLKNSTLWIPWIRSSTVESPKKIDLIWFFIGFFTFHRFW